MLLKQEIAQVKAQWENYALKEATQDRKDEMNKAYVFMVQSVDVDQSFIEDGDNPQGRGLQHPLDIFNY